jgi:YesN/AraC family two-component response regulator
MEIKILEKNYPAAEEYFVLGTGFAEKYSQRTELPGYLTGKAEILIAKNDFDSAFEVLSEAEKLNSEFPDYRNEAQILRLYAELYSRTGKYQEANRYLLLHYTAERKIDSLVSRSKLRHLYAKHNYDAAVKHADNYRRERNFSIVIAALILLGLIVNSLYYYRSRITNRQLMEKNLRLAYVNESNNFANINSQDEKTGIDFIEINTDKSDAEKKIKEPGEDLLNRISALLEDLITKEKIYLEPNLTLVSLAQRLSTNRTYLLKAIQKKYNKNFVEFINGLRIKESIRIINSSERSLLSMDGIASKSGFSNRVTFTKVFRDITGVSPSYFMKNIDTLKHEMASEKDEIT